MNVPDDDDCTVLVEAIKHYSTTTEFILEEICHGDGDCTCGRIQTQLKNNTCLVPRPHYYARPMRFGSRGPRKFLRPRQTLGEVRHFVSLGAELLEAGELSITFPR